MIEFHTLSMLFLDSSSKSFNAIFHRCVDFFQLSLLFLLCLLLLLMRCMHKLLYKIGTMQSAKLFQLSLSLPRSSYLLIYFPFYSVYCIFWGAFTLAHWKNGIFWNAFRIHERQSTKNLCIIYASSTFSCQTYNANPKTAKSVEEYREREKPNSYPAFAHSPLRYEN